MKEYDITINDIDFARNTDMFRLTRVDLKLLLTKCIIEPFDLISLLCAFEIPTNIAQEIFMVTYEDIYVLLIQMFISSCL